MPIIDYIEKSPDDLRHSVGKLLLYFYADRCAYCNATSPNVKELSDELTNIKFLRIDADMNQATAAAFDVTGLPTLILIENGVELTRTVGATTKARLRSTLERFCENCSALH